LGKVVFGDQEALRLLEQIVHPRVRRRIVELIAASETAVVMIEAIKLLEGELWTFCREIWVTTCSYECQLERLQVCRGMDAGLARARIAAQSPAEEKIARADVVIDTNGLMRDTERQFLAAWEHLMAQVEQAPRD
jgi:dephospho-CoA kinase